MEMHAAVVSTWGSPPQYQTTTLEPPSPTQHRIRILAAGVHTIVRSRAAGRHYTDTPLPHIPGIDGVGLIDNDDDDDTSKLVYFNALSSPTGSLADYINVDKSDTFPLPTGADPTTIAAIVNGGMSGWMALTARAGVISGKLAPGFSVCVLGATGVSGRAAVAIAKGIGASKVVAVGRNAVALEETKRVGADVTIQLGEKPLKEVDFKEAADVDVVLDYLWSETAAAAMNSMLYQRENRNQRLMWVGIGSVTGPLVQVDETLLRKSNTFICGCGPGSWNMKELKEQIPKLLEVLVQKGVKTEMEVKKLKDVEKSWTEAMGAKRLVFEP